VVRVVIPHAGTPLGFLPGGARANCLYYFETKMKSVWWGGGGGGVWMGLGESGMFGHASGTALPERKARAVWNFTEPH